MLQRSGGLAARKQGNGVFDEGASAGVRRRLAVTENGTPTAHDIQAPAPESLSATVEN